MLALTFLLCVPSGIFAQVGDLTGSDICGDGRQTTSIGISGADAGKYYALYRNDKLFQVRQSNVEEKDNVLSFGNFKETGYYTAVAFENPVKGFPSRRGKPVNGKITIYPVPTLIMGDTLKIKSGETIHYVPRADLQGTVFTWSAFLKYGKASGFSKTGSSTIGDTIQVEDDRPACIIYSITPHGADHIVSCNGDARDLVVIIRP
ncbi:MAG: hypothetical protein NT004_02645 [Bacteroidetes bacterium]|nr:hypothetical protein [Bacteroidota bacterium]